MSKVYIGLVALLMALIVFPAITGAIKETEQEAVQPLWLVDWPTITLPLAAESTFVFTRPVDKIIFWATGGGGSLIVYNSNTEYPAPTPAMRYVADVVFELTIAGADSARWFSTSGTSQTIKIFAERR